MEKNFIKIWHWFPFRRRYFYWDKEPYLAAAEFEDRGVWVRVTHRFTHSEYKFVGFIITCWAWDCKKIEEGLMNLDRRLRVLGNDYEKFLNIWRTGIDG